MSHTVRSDEVVLRSAAARRRHNVLNSILLISLVSGIGCRHAGNLHYAGKWVVQAQNANIMVMTTRVTRGELKGEIVRPKYFVEDAQGQYQDIKGPLIKETLHGRLSGESFDVSLGDNQGKHRLTFDKENSDKLSLDWTNGIVPPWSFRRVDHFAVPSIDVTMLADKVTPYVADLQDRLRRLADADRGARAARPISEVTITKTQHEASAAVEEVIARYGWPPQSTIGFDAARDFWLLVQHQPLDLQERVLPLMKEAAEHNEASWPEYAELYDRVAIRNHRVQRWGTQFKCQAGKAELLPTESIEDLEARRALLGLGEESKAAAANDDICAKIDN